jgi:hypothetical protein
MSATTISCPILVRGAGHRLVGNRTARCVRRIACLARAFGRELALCQPPDGKVGYLALETRCRNKRKSGMLIDHQGYIRIDGMDVGHW